MMTDPHHKAISTNDVLAGSHILVVEDEPMLLMMIEDILGDYGCCDISASNTIEDAMERIEAEHFDVVMMDLNLHGRDSYCVADALIARAVPFVFSTGNNILGIREAYRGYPVLTKPFNDKHLVTMLALLLKN